MKRKIRVPSASLLTLGAAIVVAACGGGVPAAVDPATTVATSASEDSLASLDVDDRNPILSPDLPPADINEIPIRVWVERAKDGSIGSIHVTGHAEIEVCAVASNELMSFLADGANVDGFLSFGVGEMHAAAGARDYQKQATSLIAKLKDLAAKHPDFVELRDVAPSPADPSAQDSPAAGESAAILRFRPVASGPAFIPVKRWSSAQAKPVPLEIEITTGALGVSDPVMKQLVPAVASGPIAELASLLRDKIERFDRLQAWLQSGQKLSDQAYWLQEEAGPASVGDLEADIDGLERFELACDALRLLAASLPESLASHLDGEVREVMRARAADEVCLSQVRAGVACLRHVNFTPSSTADSGDDRAGLRKFFESAATLSPFDLAVRRQSIVDALAETRGVLELVKKTGTQRINRHARETVVDGLLRGWPLPTADDEKLAPKVAVAQKQALEAWKKIIQSVAAKRNIDLRSDAGNGGRLARGNVFFAVHEVRPGTYKVTPTYAVLGPYLEVWDAERHTVTVETPETPFEEMALGSKED